MTKLLIVDDNEQNLYMLQVLLNGFGYEVTLAQDGAEALEKAHASPPDVIITDILMPVMDGFTLCRKWKKDAVLGTIPFVFYTATYADPKDEELALSLGAERFIRKPMEPSAFVEILREVIREAEAGRLVAPREPVEEEKIFLKEYNEALIRKLEDKMLQLEQTNRRLSVLYQVSSCLVEVRPLDELISIALRKVVETMGYAHVNYFTFDEETQTFYLLGSLGFPDELLPQLRRELVFRFGEERGLVGLVGQTQEPLILTDTKRDPRWITVDETLRSALFVPVAHKGHLLGVVSFLSTEVGSFTEKRAKDVTILANNLAIAIKNAQLFEQAQQEIAERVQAEETLRAASARREELERIINRSPAVVFLWRAVEGLPVEYVSDNVRQFGYDPNDFHRGGLSYSDLIHPEDLGRVIAEETRYSNQLDMTSFSQEYRIMTRAGDVRWVDDRTWLRRDATGKVTHHQGIILDITVRKQAEEHVKQSLKRLQRSLEGTIYALAATTEMRDPYTAGHQRRVAALASAVAKEMGLPEEQIEGIHMASLIHDIGKISVPAEILSKPSKLSEMEMDIIKGHSQIAYDILKGIDFPWPIADIVLQHHERMDGSGYPNGLKGDEILLEARILAVADVVEAMASHRPYRPALGLDAALDEIKKNKGQLYDPDVVDACLAVFKNGFTFEQ